MRISAILTGATLLAALTSVTAAADDSKREFKPSFNLGITTDYIFRGFSQTARNATGQGGVDASYGIFYAGIWASGLDYGNEFGTNKNIANVEVDIYAGIKPVWRGITFDLGAIYYGYPGARDKRLTAIDGELNYAELKLGWSREWWKGGTSTSTFFYSPDYTNSTGRTLTSETGFAQELPALAGFTPTISALYGTQWGDTTRFRTFVGNGADKYSYWNVGLTLAVEKFSFDLRYWDTNIKNNNAVGGFANGFCTGATFQCDGRVVGTIKFTY